MIEALIDCRACQRLVDWREQVGREKRAAYRNQDYWARPVPAFGDPKSRLVVVGLAPAAHGGNRTGRMFTGDRSGEWLYRALHRAGFADRPDSEDPDLSPIDCLITAAVRCAPPANRPSRQELANCMHWLEADLQTSRPVVMVALGAIAFSQVLRTAPQLDWQTPKPAPRFGHGVEIALGSGPTVIASYHPSQQNTFTGRLTESMLDAVFARARQLLTTWGEAGHGKLALRG
jgi:uracil-DNA glycosylase family 4